MRNYFKRSKNFDVVDIVKPREKHYFVNDGERETYLDHLDKLIISAKPSVYVRHIFFQEPRNFTTKQFAFFNIVKDPIDQFISWFYYERKGWTGRGMSKEWTHDVRNETKNISIDTCIDLQLPECVLPGVSEYLSYFCGNDDFCVHPYTEQAYLQAVQNVDKYTFIGLLEELEDSFAIAEKIFPKFFINMQGYLDSQNADKQKTKGKILPSEHSMKQLKEIMKYEIKLYDYIKQRFNIYKEYYFRWNRKYLCFFGI